MVPKTLTTDTPEGETDAKMRGYLKAYRVFNVQQIDGLEDQFPTPDEAKPLATRPIEQLSHIAANVIENMGVGYEEGGDRACYVPSLDKVHMPELSKFKGAELFYSTLFHELSHNAELRIMPRLHLRSLTSLSFHQSQPA